GLRRLRSAAEQRQSGNLETALLCFGLELTVVAEADVVGVVHSAALIENLIGDVQRTDPPHIRNRRRVLDRLHTALRRQQRKAGYRPAEDPFRVGRRLLDQRSLVADQLRFERRFETRQNRRVLTIGGGSFEPDRRIRQSHRRWLSYLKLDLSLSKRKAR